MTAALSAAVAFLTAVVLTPALIRWAKSRNLLDVPNARSSHTVATPRVGGVAIVVAVFVATALIGPGRELLWLGVGAFAIAAVSLVDDLRSLPPAFRLVTHLAIALFVVSVVGPLDLSLVRIGPLIAMPITIVWIVGLINAYNFMDGIDGIAGAQAVAAGIAWTIIGVALGNAGAQSLGAALVGASGAFLVFNWHPARVFMGDSGSAFLGYSLAVMPLMPWAHRTWLPFAALLAVAPFVFDASFTFLLRLSRGESVTLPHRTHLYQRMCAAGWSHGSVAGVYAILGLVGAAGAVSLAAGSPPVRILGVVVNCVAAFALWRIGQSIKNISAG